MNSQPPSRTEKRSSNIGQTIAHILAARSQPAEGANHLRNEYEARVALIRPMFSPEDMSVLEYIYVTFDDDVLSSMLAEFENDKVGCAFKECVISNELWRQLWIYMRGDLEKGFNELIESKAEYFRSNNLAEVIENLEPQESIGLFVALEIHRLAVDESRFGTAQLDDRKGEIRSGRIRRSFYPEGADGTSLPSVRHCWLSVGDTERYVEWGPHSRARVQQPPAP